MNDLIVIKDQAALTTSLTIAEGTENQHATVIKLARKYRDDLSEFGLVGFEIQPRFTGQHGGSDVEYALLNEPQATLLMTYMRNTAVVRKFKIQLVKAFYEMSQELHRDNVPDRRSEIAHSRSTNAPGGLDIRYNLDLTKVLANPTRKSILLLSRLTGIELEDIAELPDEASFLSEQALKQAEVKTFLTEVCRADPGAAVVASDLYAAFTSWSNNRHPGRAPLSQKAFGTLATSLNPKKNQGSDGRVQYLGISLPR